MVEDQRDKMNQTESAAMDPRRDHPAPAPPCRAIPYPAIERHGIIGDRRTAALVSADGVLDWLCLPDYDGNIVFGALLDWAKGGLWRLGPAAMMQGDQSYQSETMVLQTEWKPDGSQLILQDAMLWPEDRRAPEQEPCRVLVRSLKCVKGRARIEFDLRPGFNFAESPEISYEEHASGTTIRVNDLTLRLWCNLKLERTVSGLHCQRDLGEGEELWTVLEFGAAGHGWSVEAAREALEKNRNYWREWLKRIHQDDVEIRRSAMVVHLLTYSPEGSVVAAATTSLPERIGGQWNVDYRLSWIRDSSLALGMLGRLGDWEETER
jgi:GH15 family glucan-1,4-alpha-glucosidase